MKAKIHKIELYIVDINGRFNDVDEIVQYLEDREDIYPYKSKSETVEFDWDDDLPINSTDAKALDYEKYFK